MKTFKEYINENFSGEGYLYDTPEEAESVARQFGINGSHEHNGKYMPGETHDDWMNLVQQVLKKKKTGI